MRAAIDRFEEKVDYTGECHLWTASVNVDGYGQFYDQGRPWRAHRWIWIQTNGPIPDGLHIDHLCEVVNCVNVEHMHLVTPLEHCHQPHSKWISKEQAARTHCNRGHKLEAPNLVACKTRSGQRNCLACSRARETAKRRGRGEEWLQEESDRRYRELLNEGEI